VTAGPRGPRDDFFCWKFGVWYNMQDCVRRHAWRTTAECAECSQGCGNLRLLGTVPPKPRWAEILSMAVGEPERSER